MTNRSGKEQIWLCYFRYVQSSTVVPLVNIIAACSSFQEKRTNFLCLIGKIFQLVIPCMKMNSSGASKLTLSSEDETFLRQRVFTPCWCLFQHLLSYMLIAFLLMWTFEKTSTGQQWMNCTHVTPESQHKLSSRDGPHRNVVSLCFIAKPSVELAAAWREFKLWCLTQPTGAFFLSIPSDLNRQKKKLIYLMQV